MPLGQGSYVRSDSEENRDTVIPRFFWMTEESNVDGQKVFHDVEMVEMTFPGDFTKKPVFAVTDEHRDRWPRQYQSFKTNSEPAVDGIPLEEWPVLKGSEIKMLKSLDFRTVENVAAMSEHAIAKIGMGARQLKLKAQAYLDDAKAQAITARALEDAEKWERRSNEQAAQIERLNQEISVLSDQIRQFLANQALAAQNIATAGLPVQQLPNYGERVEQSISGFARFAQDTPTRAAPLPPGETVTIAPPHPAKRRGRPSNAELASRAQEEANG